MKQGNSTSDSCTWVILGEGGESGVGLYCSDVKHMIICLGNISQ